ncbi:hypothetical protein F5Y15DRAFT_412958 [Xylariaceae sp. FL0016]|nr:hypothetical protein F5Y15DRAFT_412958 [Xylariaceae sp. FL0016]
MLHTSMTFGGDTIATALSSTLFYLAQNRRCYEKLAEEITGIFEDSSKIKGVEVENC